MKLFLSTLSLALILAASPLIEGAENWQVTEFNAYVAAHSITQITSFYVAKSAGDEPAICSDANGALLSSAPALRSVINRQCIEGSGFNFTFQQVQDRAIELSVQDSEGSVATFTSEPEVVTVVSTGNTPLDTMTLYQGPRDFELEV